VITVPSVDTGFGAPVNCIVSDGVRTRVTLTESVLEVTRLLALLQLLSTLHATTWTELFVREALVSRSVCVTAKVPLHVTLELTAIDVPPQLSAGSLPRYPENVKGV
jgi:hypothetical protein